MTEQQNGTSVKKWTKAQEAAITATGGSVLVAAAAGSGKTAVLVERIVRKITDENRPLDVDKLLIATFTNAAAAEMRQRIREALERELIKNPNSGHLRRQIALLQQAPITTLHSFCLDVVRRHYEKLELDPGFRIANETENELLKQDVLEQLFEECYAECPEQDPFWQVLDWFGSERSDEPVLQLVVELYEFSRGHPQPETWLKEMAAAFQNGGDVADLWLKTLLKSAERTLAKTLGLLTEALELAERPAGPGKYGDNLRDDIARVGALMRLVQAGDWDGFSAGLQEFEFSKLAAIRGNEGDKALQERAKELRSQAKQELGSLNEDVYGRSLSEHRQEMAAMAPVMAKLAELVIAFAERFKAAKREKRLLDFSDMEHYCLQILGEPAETGDLRPTAAALEYRGQFAEIMLDEYQDTSMVQDEIIRLISAEHPGNLFLVGDVKQSIYRFRQAEPGLFLEKYKTFQAYDGNVPPEFANHAASGSGTRIDLSSNFRSTKAILDAVNWIFRQIMREDAAEISYDDKAELIPGKAEAEQSFSAAVEVILVDQANADANNELADEANITGNEDGDAAELSAMELEGRAIAAKITELMGANGSGAQVYDKQSGFYRPLRFSDIVILLRSHRSKAHPIMEQLQAAGIPAYAELKTGYFTATEVDVMLSLLKVIDNPLQDIPLAGVLRSPLVGLNAEQLAQIRLADKRAAFYDAVTAFLQADDGNDAENGESTKLRETLRSFMRLLDGWRDAARQGALSELIWDIYAKTGYFDLVGAYPGGRQRQANLRALYDRARQYEETSSRGLFRFLRFIARLTESGGDLGTARALGEQDNVVRVMTIHASKGLEFPVVFVAGLGAKFNMLDSTRPFLLHKQLGFGPRFVDTANRAVFPSLPHAAIRQIKQAELLAEEMRILYVALTRARERMFLLGTVKDLPAAAEKWGRQAKGGEWPLPVDTVASARSCLDWLGPALLRHPHMAELRRLGNSADAVPATLATDPSRWRLTVVPAGQLADMAEAAVAREDSALLARVKRAEPLPLAAGLAQSEALAAEIDRRLRWDSPHHAAQTIPAKTSVSEWKRLGETDPSAAMEAAELPEAQHDHAAFRQKITVSLLRRPRFLTEEKLSPTERGVAYHAVMQHLPLDGMPDEARVAEAIANMVERRLLTETERAAIDIASIAAFFRTAIGRRLLNASTVLREVPFSLAVAAGELHREISGDVAREPVLLQGVIDCMFKEDDGWVLIDYKTDRVAGRLQQAVANYRRQLELYAAAVERILRQPVVAKALYFFDGAQAVFL
ncbi:MAG TPA: helicase-exonuclease AddAB subunit AddA [Bacilli bacterium]